MIGLPENLKNKRVLDVKAGNGLHAFEAEKRKGIVVSLSNEPEPLNLLRSKLKSEVQFQLGDVFGLNSHNTGAHDVVLMYDVLDHTSEKEKAIEKAHSVIAASGKLIFDVTLDSQYSFEYFQKLLNKIGYYNVYKFEDGTKTVIRGEK